MADREQKIRRELIEYIKTNDKRWAEENMDNYSTTALTIIKTEIEVKLKQAKGKE